MLVVTMVVAVIVMLEKMLVGCDGWQMLLWWCHDVVTSDIHHKWYDDRDYDDGDGDGNDDIRIENYVITTDAR